MPAEASGGETKKKLWFSFSSANAHIICLNNWDDNKVGSDQYKFLQNDLANIDRSIYKWVIVLLHDPWYNSNHVHYQEHDAVEMKQHMEDLIYEN